MFEEKEAEKMAKGQYGASMGGSMEYRYSLKPETKNCRNCVNYQRRGDPLLNERKFGRCKEFGILITDCTNAKLCKAFQNMHESKKAAKTKHSKQRKKPEKAK